MFKKCDGAAWFAQRIVTAVMIVLLPVLAHAQSGTNGTIAGTVKDVTGAVLPGVTVEASSPALIEKVRVANTDGSGLYKIVDLKPGVYTVTFTLPGFNAVRREGIELSSSFTATINADLRVGAVEETVTVSGASPTVDVQGVVQQKVLTRDIIDSVPVGTKTLQSLGVLIPGVTTSAQDVGGSGATAGNLAVHGSRGAEEQVLLNGMTYNTGSGSGGTFTAVRNNEASTQEINFQISGFSAESPVAAVVTNAIPKEGGNTFHFYSTFRFGNHSMQWNNSTDAQVARGFTTPDAIGRNLNGAIGFGGPILRDRLWFYSAAQILLADTRVGGRFYNSATDGHSYVPDLSRPAQDNQDEGDVNTRFSYQMSQRNKFQVAYQSDWNIRNHGYGSGSCGCPLNSPEAVFKANSRPQYLGQVTWSSPVTSRLLLEAGALLTMRDFLYTTPIDALPGAYAYTDSGTSLTFGNSPNALGHNGAWQYNTRLALSYVTGSHNIKVGGTFYQAHAHTTQQHTGNGITLGLLNGAASRVTEYGDPLELDEKMKANLAIFVQDQWTIKRLTLNVGVRYDYENMYVPAETLGPAPNLPTRNLTFAPVENIPNWKNVTPRVGMAYDLFGNGKTALKINIGKYLALPNLTTFARQGNAAAQTANSVTRTWTDKNGDFVPQCDFTVLTLNGECGQVSNLSFGSPIPSTSYATTDGPTTNRGYSWELSGAIQRELRSNVSLNVGVFRRWYGNSTVTQNTLTSPSDYTPFCVIAPVDPALPNGGGYPVCGLANISVAQFGKVNNVIQMSSIFGKDTEVFTGFDINLNARVKRILLSGGTSTGRVATDSCYIVNSSQDLLNCHVTPPYQTQVKFLASTQLPFLHLSPSLTFQSLPGPQQTASFTATNAQVVAVPVSQGGLGRNLAAGTGGTVTVPLVVPGTKYGDRLNQVDVRLGRSDKLGSRRLNTFLDLYNALNASPVLSYTNTYGVNWLKPVSVLQGRLLKFGFQLEF